VGGWQGAFPLVQLLRIRQSIRVTRVMEAGITDHVWELRALLA
jgi:hypothetical protein